MTSGRPALTWRQLAARRARPVRGVLACSAAYFIGSLAIAFVARGFDLDRLPSRSALAQAADTVSRLLWAPHNAVGRALGSAAVQVPGVIPGLLLANTLAWGIAIYALSRLVGAWRRRA
ncbi:hypothetical protein [Lysobacter humi (ex Lee et al. 2017)]